jgi:hypothetical protein
MKAWEAAAAAEAVGTGGTVDEWGCAKLTVSYTSNNLLREAMQEPRMIARCVPCER